jgi:hypothetical protein
MFILSDSRISAEACAASFRRYDAYLAEMKSLFPPSAYALATSDWYFDFQDHRCPHDAWLEEATLTEPASGERNEIRTTALTTRLLGAYHDGHIEFIYSHVFRYECRTESTHGHGDWLWDEFRLSSSGQLLHEIEWSAGGRWLIEAADVEFRWIPKSPPLL